MSAVNESLSVEETNKLRVSLGLKPLPVETDSPKGEGEGEPAPQDADELAESNYAARRDAERKAKEAKEVEDRLARSKNQRELKAKLKGRGLGDLGEGEEDEGGDLKAWIKKQKKRSKILAAEAARKEKELAEREGETYGEADLEGLKVAHDAEEFEGGDEVVLTLKDSRILDGEDDELHNVNLTEDAKAREALKLKRKGRQAGQYTGLDDEEFEGPAGEKRGVLSKYNEDDGKGERSFRLGAAPAGPAAAMEVDQIGDAAGREARKVAATQELHRDLISGDYDKTFERDYLQEGDPGFKKPKSKKKKKDRSTRKAATVDDDVIPPPPATNGDAMDIGDVPAPAVEEDAVVDDEEVAFAMAQMRREAGRMRSKAIKNNHALGLARRRAEVKIEEEEDEEEALPPTQKADEEGEDGRISSLDETSQFIRNLGARREEEEARRVKAESVVAPAKTEADAPLVEMEDLVEDTEMRSGEDDEAGGDEEAEMARLMAGDEAKADEQDRVTGGEAYVAGGMAATLSILKQQGLLKPMTPEERERERLYQQKQAWQADQRRKDALRDLEREQSRKGASTSAKDQAQREYDNRQREAVAARETARAFETYKPVVDIKYHDDFGRQLDPKEAWKALSHKFHGKGSGKLKTEKRIKKIEEQKKMEAMASGDTPTGTNEAFRKRQEMVGSATMILSVGNKGSAPQQEEFLASLSKPKKDKAGAAAGGKGKGRANKAGTPSMAQDLMMGLGAATASLPGSGSETPMLPRKAAGFKPIAARAAASASGVESPAVGASGGSSTPKISIGLGGKRKAEEEAEGSPSAKRVA